MTQSEMIRKHHRCPKCGGTTGFSREALVSYRLMYSWDNKDLQESETNDDARNRRNYSRIMCEDCGAWFRDPYKEASE